MVADGESRNDFGGAPVVLDATLDVLGDWGSDSPWLTCLPTPPGSPLTRGDTTNDPVSKPTSYRRKRDARDAKRAALQAQIHELTLQLEKEKKQLPQRPEVRTGDALALSREWASMAKRQRRQRQAAETEHAQLQQAYDSQCRSARQIDRLVQKALKIGRRLMPTRETVTIASYCGPTMDVVTHMAYLDQLHHQVPVVEASVFTTTFREAFQSVNSRADGIHGVQIEFVADWVLPFPVTDVADAVWAQITRMEHEGRHVVHEHVVSTSLALVSTFVSAPDGSELPGSNHGQVVNGTTHGQTALRRFEATADGAIWLLAMNHARIVGDDSTTKGFMKGDGWICIEPLLSGSALNLCRIKLYHRMHGRPVNYASASRDERARWVYAAVSTPVRTQWERYLTQTLQAIENTLVLDQTML